MAFNWKKTLYYVQLLVYDFSILIYQTSIKTHTKFEQI